MANSAYFKTTEALEAQKKIIASINDRFKEVVKQILDPEPAADLSNNPFFAAGQAGLDRLNWDYKSGNLKVT